MYTLKLPEERGSQGSSYWCAWLSSHSAFLGWHAFSASAPTYVFSRQNRGEATGGGDTDSLPSPFRYSLPQNTGFFSTSAPARKTHWGQVCLNYVQMSSPCQREDNQTFMLAKVHTTSFSPALSATKLSGWHHYLFSVQTEIWEGKLSSLNLIWIPM